MAGIDHTIICFHNGKLMRSLYKSDDDSYESAIPFEYSRDAELLGVDIKKKENIPVIFTLSRFRQWLAKHLLDNPPAEYTGYFHKDDIQIFTYESESYNVIFYLQGNESYVMLGGYGHYMNPYTHFYERGYGEEFERRMAKECFEWLFSHVFEDCARTWFDGTISKEETDLMKLEKRFHYKSYWDMTKEEREMYYMRGKMIEYDDQPWMDKKEG